MSDVKWCYSRDPESPFIRADNPGREAAIEEARRELNLEFYGQTEFYIAPCEPFPNMFHFDGRNLTEQMNEWAGEYIEDCEWPNLSRAEENELGHVVSQAVQKFFEEKKLGHDFYLVGDIERILK